MNTDHVAAGLTVDPMDFRAALGCFATGVTIVTTRSPDGRWAGVTCNSFASLSLDPPLVLWSLAHRSSSRLIFEAAEGFAVNVLADDQEEIALRFARSGCDKFAGTPIGEGLRGIPLIDGALATFECRTDRHLAGGDHQIFIGEVQSYAHRVGAPLLFSRGRFRSFEMEL